MVEGDIIDVSDIPAQYKARVAEGTEPIEERLFLINNLRDAKKAFEREFKKRKLLRKKR